MEISDIRNPDYTDVEQWTPVVFRYKVIPNYFVSSWGRVRGPSGKLLNRRPFPALPIGYKSIQNNFPFPYDYINKSCGVYVQCLKVDFTLDKDLFEDYNYRSPDPKTGKGTRMKATSTVHKLVMNSFKPHDQYPVLEKEVWDNTPEEAKHIINEMVIIDHLDDNPTNNHISNLAYVTPRENCHYVKAANQKKENMSWNNGNLPNLFLKR
jgi:hypothetical protein